MAYRVRLGDRTLRLDVTRSPDGCLIVDVVDLAGDGAAASGSDARAPAAGTRTAGRLAAAGEPGSSRMREGGEPPARSYTLDASLVGGWLLARLGDGRSIEAFVERRGGATAVWIDGTGYDLELVDERALRRRAAGRSGGGPQVLLAPMPGKIVKHLVAVGDRVEAGQGVIVVEAMKMENELRAPSTGVVKALPAAEGTAVEAGATLVVLE